MSSYAVGGRRVLDSVALAIGKNTRKGYWHIADSFILHRAITKENLRKAGYVTLMGEYLEWHPKQESPYAEPHVRWYERSVNNRVGDKHL